MDNISQPTLTIEKVMLKGGGTLYIQYFHLRFQSLLFNSSVSNPRLFAI